MTHLRKMMLEELERRNYSEATKECYIRAVEEFSKYFDRPPDRLRPEHIRQFQAHLFTDRKLAPNTVNQQLAALLLLRQNSAPAMECRGNSISKERDSFAGGAEPGRSGTTDRLSHSPFPSGHTDDPVGYRYPSGRTRTSESPRY